MKRRIDDGGARPGKEESIMPASLPTGGYHLTREVLMHDLYRAYLDARKHKRGKHYQIKFELHLEDNLSALCDELWNRTYRMQPSKCFIIEDPTIREVFAADFRDRIVHHLYYNYTYRMFDQTFIADSYSCRKGKGTLYGVDRIEKHIREESQGYTRPCYVLKMDISGYFMHIDRQRLLQLCLDTLRKVAHRKSPVHGRRWMDITDMDFVEYLTREIVLLNPTEECRLYGRHSDWQRLPSSKSLFCSKEGCGLPIGNLTSQVFSNVYMNIFDQWMKREMKCRHYGRYVDDFYVVSTDREWLCSLVEPAVDFLSSELGLHVNKNKTVIRNACHGVSFLGCYLKPWRRYVERKTWKRIKRHLRHEQQYAGVFRLRSVVNSYLGLLRHVRSYSFTKKFFGTLKRVNALGYITQYKRKLVLSNYTLDTMRVKSYLRMIDDEDYLLSYSDVEIACHEYVNRYIEKKE